MRIPSESVRTSGAEPRPDDAVRPGQLVILDHISERQECDGGARRHEEGDLDDSTRSAIGPAARPNPT
jgi:hypothetical protein